MLEILLAFGLFLMILIVNSFDYFNKNKIPAFITTTILLFAFALNSTNLYILVFSAIIGIIFIELDYWKSITELKLFIACSLFLNIFMFGIFVFLILISSICLRYYNFNINNIKINDSLIINSCFLILIGLMLI